MGKNYKLSKQYKGTLLRKHLRSYKYALRGLGSILLGQLNFQIEFFIAIIVIIAGIFFELSTVEWIIIAFSIAIVLIAEGLNSAIEALSDAIVKDYNNEIRYAKDIGAGAVLLSTILAAFVGIIIFWPHLLNLFE